MRYIYYIAFIVAALSAAIGYSLSSSRVPQKDVALVINDRVVSVEEFNRLYATRPPDITDREEFLNSFITKELLIQESQKEGIDKEEQFRKSIQNFYEQSLIKLLVDRQFASCGTAIGEEELNRYISLVGSTLVVTTFRFGGAKEAKVTPDTEGSTRTVLFHDLSGDLQDAIVRVKEGETTAPVRSGDGFLIARLDKVILSAPSPVTDQERTMIRAMLGERKRERSIRDWVAELRKKASIKITLPETTGGRK